MDLAENLKSTLDRTYQLAIGLEQVSTMIYPRKIGPLGRKRLISINKEIKTLSQMMRTKTSYSNERKNANLHRKVSSLHQSEIVADSPGHIIKKKLSLSIKEINERVKMSRAGKRTIGKYISKEAFSPPVIRNISSMHASWQEREKSPKMWSIGMTEEKPQPYVPLTSGKIEDPISLPSFEEFLEAKGAEFMVRKGKDELVYRIQKAMEQLGKLKDTLDVKLANWNNLDERRHRTKRITQTRMHFLTQKVEHHAVEKKKNNDLRVIIKQYYETPVIYPISHIKTRSTHNSPKYNNNSLSSEAEGNLEESLRDFYKSKATENKKLLDILEKIQVDRPHSIKDKISLIQDDKEKYKNKHHSIEKFNDFRETVEQRKRARQFANFQQAISYLEVLDEFKRKRHEPLDSELLVLELWKRMVEGGWVVSKEDLEEMSNLLSQEEISSKNIQFLLSKFAMACSEKI